MKKLLTTTLTILCLLTATAQDVIVKKDGDTLTVYNLKINTKFITYKEKPGNDAPSKRISKAKVLTVKKRNGKNITISKPDTAAYNLQNIDEQPTNTTVKKIQEQQATSQTTIKESSKGEIKRAVADNNILLVNKYNKPHSGYGDKKQTKEEAASALAIMGVTSGSTLSNEDVEIEISENEECTPPLQYNIYIHNKTDKTIYLDLENCFRIYNDGTFDPYYSSKQIRQNKKSNTKIALLNKATTSYPLHARRKRANSYATKYTIEEKKETSQIVKEQKKITIPPKGKVALPPKTSLDKYDEILRSYDTFYTSIQYPLNDWQVVNISESQTPYKNSFVITYSPDKNFKTYSTVNFGVCIRQLIGLGIRFSKLKKSLIHDYDKYTILGEVYFEKK